MGKKTLPKWFLLLFMFTELIMFGSSFHNRNSTHIHGLIHRCDRDVYCTFDQRGLYDNSWLCCEDGSFWAVVHILVPLAIQYTLGNPAITAFTFFAWEAIEADLLQFFSNFLGLYPADASQLETVSGSLIADAQLQGTFGLLLGIIIARIANFPGLLACFQQKPGHFGATERYVRSKWIFWKFLLAFFIVICPFLGAGRASASGFVYGPYVSIPTSLVTINLIVPFILTDEDCSLFKVRTLYVNGLIPLSLSIILISFGGIGLNFLANDFFQTWVFYHFAVLMCLTWLLLKKPEEERKISIKI